MFKKLSVYMMLTAFVASPAAFGAQLSAPEQIYKQTYVSLMKNQDTGKVMQELVTSVQANHMEVKDVLAAAVVKGWLTQDQMNVALEMAQKYAYLGKDANFVKKVQSGQFSDADMQAFSDAFQGQNTGAAYWCGRYGCWRGHRGVWIGAGVLVLLIVAGVAIGVAASS